MHYYLLIHHFKLLDKVSIVVKIYLNNYICLNYQLVILIFKFKNFNCIF